MSLRRAERRDRVVPLDCRLYRLRSRARLETRARAHHRLQRRALLGRRGAQRRRTPRDREYPRERRVPGRRRILVLGDSVAWCWGVEREECFTERLEAALPDTDVINAGVPGYSTAQELLYYERDGRTVRRRSGPARDVAERPHRQYLAPRPTVSRSRPASLHTRERAGAAPEDPSPSSGCRRTRVCSRYVNYLASAVGACCSYLEDGAQHVSGWRTRWRRGWDGSARRRRNGRSRCAGACWVAPHAGIRSRRRDARRAGCRHARIRQRRTRTRQRGLGPDRSAAPTPRRQRAGGWRAVRDRHGDHARAHASAGSASAARRGACRVSILAPALGQAAARRADRSASTATRISPPPARSRFHTGDSRHDGARALASLVHGPYGPPLLDDRFRRRLRGARSMTIQLEPPVTSGIVDVASRHPLAARRSSSPCFPPRARRRPRPRRTRSPSKARSAASSSACATKRSRGRPSAPGWCCCCCRWFRRAVPYRWDADRRPAISLLRRRRSSRWRSAADTGATSGTSGPRSASAPSRARAVLSRRRAAISSFTTSGAMCPPGDRATSWLRNPEVLRVLPVQPLPARHRQPQSAGIPLCHDGAALPRRGPDRIAIARRRCQRVLSWRPSRASCSPSRAAPFMGLLASTILVLLAPSATAAACCSSPEHGRAASSSPCSVPTSGTTRAPIGDTDRLRILHTAGNPRARRPACSA